MLNDDEIAVLNVCSINQIGAFLDWGEPKDLSHINWHTL